MKIILRIIPSLAALACLCFLYVFAAKARPAMDDFHVWAEVQEKGIPGLMTDTWEHWSGRWAATLLVGLCTYLFPLFSWVGVIFILQFILLTWSLARLLSFIFSKEWPWVTACLIVFFWVFTTPQPGQSWYWISGAGAHIWGWIAGIWGLVLLLGKKRSPALNIATGLCWALAGGCGEQSTLIWGVLLGILAIRQWRKNRWTAQWTVAVVAFLISAAFMIGAPGNLDRMAFSDTDKPGALLFFKRWAYWFLRYFKTYYHWSHAVSFALFFLPWLSIKVVVKHNYGKWLLWTTLAFPFIVALYILPTVVAFNSVGPSRTLTGLSLYPLIIIGLAGIWIGQKIRPDATYKGTLRGLWMLPGAMALVSCLYFSQDVLFSWPLGESYITTYDAQMDSLQNIASSNSYGDTIYVSQLYKLDKLTPLHYWASEEDTFAMWSNRAVSRALKLDAVILAK